MSRTLILLTCLSIFILASCASKKIVETDPTKVSSFIAAAGLGNLIEVKKFVSAGYDVNSKNMNGTTAAMMAAKNSQLEVLSYLKVNGANLNFTDQNGDNVMTFAITGNQTKAVQHLLSLGVSPDLSVYHDLTPPLLAMHLNRPHIVRVLLATKPNLNAQDTDGNTMLHLSVDKNLDEMLSDLVSMGANTNIRNVDGKTALDLATEDNNLRLVAILKNGPILKGK